MEDEVNQSNRKWSFVVLALAGILTVAACHKKVAPAPPPPPPAPPAAPTASLTANPATIEQGQSSTLSWTTQDATEVTLEGIGKVGPSGSQMVTPTTSTTYRLTAKGAGGTQEATARVTVTAAPQTTAAPSLSDQELFARSVKDIYFDYDSYAVPAADQATVQADAAFLKSHPGMRFTIEGHCDERGSTEYNLALGENRANAVKQALVNLGVPAASMKTISYGKEKPVCTEHNEACWQQNRRAHFALGQ